MKIILNLLLISMVLQSCQSQSEFDLSSITFTEHINTLPSANIKYKKIYNTEFVEPQSYYETYNNELLFFYGATLAGRDNSMKNRVSFHFNKTDSIIGKYKVHTYTIKSSEKLLETLQKMLGKAEFTHFTSIKDKQANNFSAKVWENREKNITWFLMYSLREIDDKTIKRGTLHVIDNSQVHFYESMLSGPFQYYGDFIEYRKNHKTPNYTYQQFLEDERKKDKTPDNNYYILLTQ